MVSAKAVPVTIRRSTLMMVSVPPRPSEKLKVPDPPKAEPSKVDDVVVHHARRAGASEPIGEGVLVAVA